ncbi:MAG: sulfite exporter TauE/SafE family protein [Bacteroidetes bacterium]|nr:sulfite exporter TauE/SafE family protein [Bacteroidota bacterium]
MIDPIYFVLYIVIGLFTGIISALFGIGGGIVFIPTLLFTLPALLPGSEIIPLIAISTSLFAGSFASTSSFFNHFRIKNIDFKAAALLAGGTVISAIFVPRILITIPSDAITGILALILSGVAIKMLLDKGDNSPVRKLNIYFITPMGILVGAISAAGGLGGGIFYLPILHYLFGFDIKKAVGTSIMTVSITMITAAASYATADCPESFAMQLGFIHFGVGLALGISAAVGAFIGIRYVDRFKSSKMKKYFAILIIIMVIKLMF